MDYNMRIGIFGGTFNPVHKGHLFLADQAKKHLDLNKVIFVPAYTPPHKPPEGIIDADKRCHMLKLALSGSRYSGVSRYEVDRKRKVYSIDTIRYFKRISPKHAKLFFLLGADSLKSLSLWKDLNKIFELCELIVFSRPGFSLKTPENRIKTVYIDALDMSSSGVRDAIKNNYSIRELVPKTVADYIKRNKLYR
jgi:nicotinate-nucleotide adenylyltransferase